jgi:hypothetical protein
MSKGYKNLTDEPRNKKKNLGERTLYKFVGISVLAHFQLRVPPFYNAAETRTSSRYSDMHHCRFK